MIDRRFDEYDYVDCNQCQEYWTDNCDGVPERSERPCTSFKAIRAIDIPQEVAALRTQVKVLTAGLAIIASLLALDTILQFLW